MSDINQGGNENIEVLRSEDNFFPDESSVSALGVVLIKLIAETGLYCYMSWIM